MEIELVMTDIGHGDRTSDDGYWSWRFTPITFCYTDIDHGDLLS